MPNIIPQPSQCVTKPGHFTLNPETAIHWRGSHCEDLAELCASYLRPATAYPLPVQEGDAAANTIFLEQKGEAEFDDAGFTDESYSLTVTEDGVHIKAENDYGLARGIQTLRQLCPPEVYHLEDAPIDWQIPAVEIEDAPRFRWRGMHLDVARHFFNIDEVCRYIDLMALHRFNQIHLHLTEDQGWRPEIKQYPKLVEVGSMRKETIIGHHNSDPQEYDGLPHGGYYTQDDLRELVAFARQRRVNLLPEIDMPGHMQAAIAAYPELGNLDEQLELRTRWGISEHILNPSDETITFMQNVLEEIMDIFPSRFIHIGGDEAPKKEWQESEFAQKRIKELGLKDEHELQSWFIRQMDDFISSKGRRLIGWDEILEGGLAENATVMSWRGEKGGIEAAEQGHDVVMAPNQYTYFDYYQKETKDDEPLAIGGMLPMEKVYSYEPFPEELPEEKHKHILGGQGQLWTEYIPDINQLEYMAFPRACALSEVLWLDPDKKDFDDFKLRFADHRKRLHALAVNYCK